jgi:hypothetical protein
MHMYKHRRTYTCSVVRPSCTLPTNLYQESLTYLPRVWYDRPRLALTARAWVTVQEELSRNRCAPFVRGRASLVASHKMIDSALKSKRGSTVDALTGNDTANDDDESIEYM